MQVSGQKIVVLGTGGTIAGTSAQAGDNIGYTAAQVGVEHLLAGLPGGQWGFLIVVSILTFVLAFFLDFFELAFIIVPLLGPVADKMGIDIHEVIRAAATGGEAVATDCLVNVKEERAVELFSQARAT